MREDMSNADQTVFVSIIICTANRCKSLEKTLMSLHASTYLNIEIAIVDASDNTDVENLIQQAKSWYRFELKFLKITQKNISISRNVGIKNTIGEIIFFLDDDAIAPPNWVEEMLNVYRLHGNHCAGVGGTVRDMTRPGWPLQFYRGITNTYSVTLSVRDTSSMEHNNPEGPWYSGLMGTNSSYRRQCLDEIGNYDEFFEYFLDETDVCLRLIQAGYKIHYSDVVIDHYPQPSHNRLDPIHLTCWYPLTKNTAYFLLKYSYGKEALILLKIRLAMIVFRRCFVRVIRLKLSNKITWSVLSSYLTDIQRGFSTGWNAGMEFHRR
jgi:GT2 family glycosyltransferase